MKKTCLLLLLCLLATACNRSLTLEQPEITHNLSTNNLVLERIVCTPEATRLDLTVCCLPGGRFSLSPETHLQSSKGERKYALTRTEGVVTGKKIQSDSTGLTAVSLFFEPLADDEEQIDFIESEEWQLLGISLSPRKKPAKIECLIEGTVTGRPQSTAILLNSPEEVFNRYASKENIVIPVRNGKFSYRLRTDTCTAYGLCFNDEWINGRAYIKDFFAEPGRLVLTIKGDDTFRVEGGKLNDEYQRLRSYGHERMQPIFDRRDSLDKARKFYTPEVYALFDEMDSCSDRTKLNLLSEKFQNLRVDGKAYSREGDAWDKTAQKTITEIGEWEFAQIKGHPSLATYYLLHEKLKACIVYDKQPAPDSLVDVFRALYLPSYPEHPFTREIGTYLQSQQTFVGGKYIDLVLPDTTGTPHRLSELLRGSKIALIDFWSIHCGPCRRTSKAMIPVYEKYKDKGFCIVGISRDGRQQMIRGIRHDGYPWINLIDEYNRNQIFKSYGIDNSAGYTFLVDSCGTVIAAGASAEEMTAIVERYCQ